MNQQEFRSRPLQVRLSSAQGAKRSATTVLARVGASQSPSGVNGNKEQSPDVEVPTGERAARTLGLINIPDTVNDARIRALVEPHGKLIKVILRPDHQGAIVEFADVNDAGKASLELEGKDIGTGRKLHVGTVPEMLRQRAEKKGDRISNPKEKPATLLQPTGPIKRPVQPGARGGRRGGLGIKRGGSVAHSTSSHSESVGTTEGETKKANSDKPQKSNDDFRSMIQRPPE